MRNYDSSNVTDAVVAAVFLVASLVLFYVPAAVAAAKSALMTSQCAHLTQGVRPPIKWRLLSRQRALKG